VHTLIDFFSQHPGWTLSVVFAAALLESVTVIGTLIPGNSVVLAAGVLIGLQNLRTDLVDQMMVAVTELGSAMVAIAVIAAVSLVLAHQRCWRTLGYWWTAAGFAQALVWTLKITFQRARPLAMYDGVDRFSFPSGRAATSIVLCGFLAFLPLRGKPIRVKFAIELVAVLLVVLIAFSRLYLGAHWLSDVLASLSLGTAWVALLSIAYLQHVCTEPLPSRALFFAALGALVLAGTAVVVTQHAADTARYAPRQLPASERLSDWRVEGWQRLPARRSEVDGDREEPLSVQWAGTANQIVQQLEANGWRRPPPWTLRTTLYWLLPSPTVGQLPVLVKFHQGAPPAISLEKALDKSQRPVTRLWPTPYQVDQVDQVGSASKAQVALWVGMVSLEHLAHPGGLVTLAMTDPDAGTPIAQLVRSLQESAVHLDIQHTDTRTVLLAR
jgi:membrane-associated phospholipid phosphatase